MGGLVPFSFQSSIPRAPSVLYVGRFIISKRVRWLCLTVESKYPCMVTIPLGLMLCTPSGSVADLIYSTLRAMITRYVGDATGLPNVQWGY